VRQRSDVRPVAITDAAAPALQFDVTFVYRDRSRETSADADVQARSIKGGGDGQVVPVAALESRYNDNGSGQDEDRRSVGSTRETDGDTRPVTAKLPLPAGADTTDFSSSTTKQLSVGRIE